MSLLTRATAGDAATIVDILSHYPEAVEEGLDYNEDVAREMIECPGVVHILFPGGFFQFVPFNNRTMILHPCGRGASKHVAEAMRMAGAAKFAGFVPDFNERAARFFERAGFDVEGHMKNSIIHNGRPWGQTVYGKEL